MAVGPAIKAVILVWCLWQLHAIMMTLSNGNIFRITGHLCGEFTGPRWIPRTKASDAFSLICFWINGWVNNCEAGDLRRYRAHCDVIVMIMMSHDEEIPWEPSISTSSMLSTEKTPVACVTKGFNPNLAELPLDFICGTQRGGDAMFFVAFIK